VAALVLSSVAVAAGEDRAVPFWPDAVPASIRAQIDGQAALETVREISRFHRVQGSPGFAAATELLREKLRRAGFNGSTAAIEKFPADGKARYAEIVGPLGVYHFDYLDRALGEGSISKIALSKRDGGDVLAWEAFNLADGRRSISDIRDILTGRYSAVPVSEISEYFDLLARARAVSLQ
jgi:hypothetical protein